MDAARTTDDLPRDPWAAELHAIADRIEAARALSTLPYVDAADLARLQSGLDAACADEAHVRGVAQGRRLERAALATEDLVMRVVVDEQNAEDGMRLAGILPTGEVLATDFAQSTGDCLRMLAEVVDAHEAEAAEL